MSEWESTILSERIKESTDEPARYAVILINDNYSTFDFVVKVLMSVFHKSIPDAVKITQDVHHKGKGICGFYTLEIAETKIEQVSVMSKQSGYPLKCIMEKI